MSTRPSLIAVVPAALLGLVCASGALAQTIADVKLCIARPLVPNDCNPAGPPIAPGTLLLISPNQPFNWSIRITIALAEGRSFGLAGFVCDLACTESPPGTEQMVLNTMTPGDVPAPMATFSRPLGISNKPAPGSGLLTGYGGTPMLRPTDNRPTLVQIGGAQNTFGVAGTNIGQVHVVTTGVAMGQYGELVASGTMVFTGGQLAYGYYTFTLDNILVNVLASVPVPNTITRSASIPYGSNSVTLMYLCRADFNGSGSVTIQDVFDFLAAYFANSASADINQSGSVTVQDVYDFLTLFFTGC